MRGHGVLAYKRPRRHNAEAPFFERVGGFQQGIVVMAVAVHAYDDGLRAAARHPSNFAGHKLRHASRVHREPEHEHVAGVA